MFAAQIAFRRRYGNESQQKLNLLEFLACQGETVGRTSGQGRAVPKRESGSPLLAVLLHPDNFGAETDTPNPAIVVDRTKERFGSDPGGRRPGVNSSFYSIWNRDGPYVAAVADQIGYDPVLFRLLH